MANKSNSRHLVRLNLPKHIKIHRKISKYIIKPIPGPHPIDNSLPIAVLLRDYMGIAMNMREVKYILRNKKVKVDNRYITEPKFPVGFQDILEIEGIKYRIDLDEHGYFILKNQTDLKKLLKVIGKNKVKGGKLQYTFHDGRTLLSEDNSIKVGDSVIFDLENKKIVNIISQNNATECIVLRGKHRGFRGKIKQVLDIGKKVADIINDKGEVIRTDYKYLFFLR